MAKILIVPVRGPLILQSIRPGYQRYAALLGGDYAETYTGHDWRDTTGALTVVKKIDRGINERAAVLLERETVYGPVLFYGTAYTGPPHLQETDVPPEFVQYAARVLDSEP